MARGDIVPFFNDIFDALCKLSADADPNVQNAAHLLDRLVKDIVTESSVFSIGAFIPLLRERLTVLNPYVRQFLVSWITVLDSVPGICMLEYLPEFLDGLLNMLSDPNREIRQQVRLFFAPSLPPLSPPFAQMHPVTPALLYCGSAVVGTYHYPVVRAALTCALTPHACFPAAGGRGAGGVPRGAQSGARQRQLRPPDPHPGRPRGEPGRTA